jgi:apolipoprotein N-acyltransferase
MISEMLSRIVWDQTDRPIAKCCLIVALIFGFVGVFLSWIGPSSNDGPLFVAVAVIISIASAVFYGAGM